MYEIQELTMSRLFESIYLQGRTEKLKELQYEFNRKNTLEVELDNITTVLKNDLMQITKQPNWKYLFGDSKKIKNAYDLLKFYLNRQIGRSWSISGSESQEYRTWIIFDDEKKPMGMFNIEADKKAVSKKYDWYNEIIKAKEVSGIDTISFKPSSFIFAKDVLNLFKKLMEEYDVIRWSADKDNPFNVSYKRKVKELGGIYEETPAMFGSPATYDYQIINPSFLANLSSDAQKTIYIMHSKLFEAVYLDCSTGIGLEDEHKDLLAKPLESKLFERIYLNALFEGMPINFNNQQVGFQSETQQQKPLVVDPAGNASDTASSHNHGLPNGQQQGGNGSPFQAGEDATSETKEQNDEYAVRSQEELKSANKIKGYTKPPNKPIRPIYGES